MIDENFIQQRILKLVADSGESERSFSSKMGRSHSYLGNITSGRALPSMTDFLEICRLLNVAPKDFFDEENQQPTYRESLFEDLMHLSSKDVVLIKSIIERLRRQ